MKKVSVILTTYNSAGTIETTLQTILNQRGVNAIFELEVVVVDDCSSDQTWDILGKSAVSRFRTERNSGGPNTGRNIGLNVASGDYICIADHDDSWENHRLVSLLPYLEKAPIVTSGYTLVDEVKNKNIVRKNSSDASHLFFSKNETFLKKLTKSLSGQNTYLGSIIFRKELKHILFEEHFGMVDFDWILRMFHQQESIEVCDSLYTRYVTDQNLSLNEAYRIKDFYYSLMQIESYENLYPREVSLAYRKIHGSRARYYYLMGNMKKARFYFKRSGWNLVTLLYYLTTFAGSGFVKKRFNVFG